MLWGPWPPEAKSKMEVQVFTNLELNNLTRIQNNLTLKKDEIYDNIGIYMVDSVIQNFEQQGRPNPWPENAISTQKQKAGSLILHESGFLRAGIMYWIEGDSVFIGPSGPSIPYSRIQQKGGWTGRGHSTYIPARPYLVMQFGDRIYIIGMIRREVLYG
jgi:phage gpG-like protein